MKDQILSLIKIKGPSLPTGIAKEMKADSFFISAHLSELKERGKIKISNVKVGGGSPLYYIPGQESQLQDFASNLGDKQKKVYDLLREKKVLRDSSLVPVFRAAVRSIKDFAYPFTVNFKGQKEVFWKWYLLPNEEASSIVRSILGIKEEKKDGKKEEKNESSKKEPEKEANNARPLAQEKKVVKTQDKAEFYGEINEYFMQNKIRVIEENVMRKTEVDFIVEVPSPVGELKYFVKAKSKKKLNDGDLSSAFVQGQTKRLPVLVLGRDLTKKAQDMLDNEFKGMKFKKI